VRLSDAPPWAATRGEHPHAPDPKGADPKGTDPKETDTKGADPQAPGQTGADPTEAPPIPAQGRTKRGQLRLAGLLHPFSWGARAPVLDTAALERQLAQPFGIASITSRLSGHAAAHQLSLDWLGPHRIGAWVGTPVEIRAAPHAPPTLWLPQGGRLEWESDGRFTPLPPGSLLILSSGGYRLRSGNCSLVAIALALHRLELQVLNLAAPADPVEDWRQLVRWPLLCQPAGTPPEGALAAAMASMLILFERVQTVEPRLVALLQLDQLFERLLATLLVAASAGLEGLQLSESGGSTAPQAELFDALLARIRSNLSEPIDLNRLETWAQRSRRELQVVFRDRLGCTPMQWLRRERLQLARRRLEHPHPQDTVASIASASGYPNAARFSADFRREFDLAPSSLLRRAPERPRP
jgi:AraC-like DNA-binding protein